MTPVLEIRLILPVPGASWGYVCLKDGHIIASDEGEHFHQQPGAAFMAAVEAVKATIRTEKGGRS